jgi:hypothetical protein
VDHAERVLAEHMAKRAVDRAICRSPPQPRHVLARAQDDVNRMVLRDLRTRAVRRIEATPGLLATRALARSAPRPGTQIELQLWLVRRPLPTPDRASSGSERNKNGNDVGAAAIRVAYTRWPSRLPKRRARRRRPVGFSTTTKRTP